MKIKLMVRGFSILILLMFYSSLSHAEVSFLAMGDSPYSDEGYYLVDKEIKNISKSTKFIIHLGDIKPKEKKCKEKDYSDFRDLLKQSPIPVFVIPGDNDYDVCENKLKAKQFWDQYISEFEKNWKLEFLVRRQKEQSENFSFFLESTLFIGINLFEKRDRDNIKFNKIMHNNISWIKENLKKFEKQTKSLVILAHDFSGLRNKNSTYLVCENKDMSLWAKENFESKKYFSDQLINIAKTFNRPILYMQGNHHCWTHDFPYKDVNNIERIVVDKIEKSPLVQIKLDEDKFKVDRRKNKRIDFFIQDAKSGDVWSQYFLSKEYLKIKDYKNAKKWITKASNKKFPPAMLELGNLFKEEKKYTKALENFKLVTQIEILPNMFFKNNDDQNIKSFTYTQRIKEYKKNIIKIISAYANFYLGVIYKDGLGVVQNHQKALNYFKKGGEGNIGMSHYNIAVMYYNGIGVNKNFGKAKEWCEKGASRGVLICDFMLGLLYLKGQGVEQSYLEAIKWFKLAKNFGPNLFELGVIYEKGLGVKQDRKTAVHYFNKAAMLGQKRAIRILDKLGIVPSALKSSEIP